MTTHLMTPASESSNMRPRLAGPNYRGRHRRPSPEALHHPGALVHEPGSRSFSSIIRLIDTNTALVRHIGTFDDHTVALTTLDAVNTHIRIGADFNDSH